MTNEQKDYDEKELVEHLAERTKVSAVTIQLVLKHEQAFIDQAKPNKQGEVDIDSDELVDYILKQKDVKLDELTLETILDMEMEYLLENGFADYDE